MKIKTRPFIYSFLACASMVVAGCNDVKVTTYHREMSPDKKWVAYVEKEEHGGPGNAALILTVKLKRDLPGYDPVDVLMLDNNDKGLADAIPRWRSDGGLDIDYVNGIVDFQAIKAGGMAINSKDVSHN
jgi:hypothetical protein